MAGIVEQIERNEVRRVYQYNRGGDDATGGSRTRNNFQKLWGYESLPQPLQTATYRVEGWWVPGVLSVQGDLGQEGILRFDLGQSGHPSLGHDEMKNREVTMPAFDVRFIKTVCDDTGHEHRACQSAFTLDAPSLTEAMRRAEADFCRQKRVHDWTIFADAVEFRSTARPGAGLVNHAA